MNVQVGRIASAGDRAGRATPGAAFASPPCGDHRLARLLAEIAAEQSFFILGDRIWAKIVLADVTPAERAELEAAYTARRLFLADRLAFRANVVSMSGMPV